MKHKKKKDRTAYTTRQLDQSARAPSIRYQLPNHWMNAQVLDNIVQAELHRNAPVVHINPDDYSPEAIQALVDEANLREGY